MAKSLTLGLKYDILCIVHSRPLFLWRKAVKSYTTGQVAKICGGKTRGFTSRKVAKLFDKGEINGHIKDSKYHRRSHRRIPPRDLVDFMIRKGIPFDGLDGDVAVQKAILCRRAEELKEAIAKAKKRGDIFLRIDQSADVLLEIARIEALGSLEDLRGIARNNCWAKVFRKVAELIEQHTRVCIANSKK